MLVAPLLICSPHLQVRLGGDSHLTFGHCALCIHPAMDPMASPSGHLYCKECIVEYLLLKTQELKRQKEAFEEQQKAKGEQGTQLSWRSKGGTSGPEARLV